MSIPPRSYAQLRPVVCQGQASWGRPGRARRAAWLRVAVISSLLALGLATGTQDALAHKNGIAAQGCDGCHSGGKMPTVTLTASPMEPTAGQATTVTVSVSQTNGMVAGFYLTKTYGAGAFKTTETGTALASTDGSGVLHTMPRTGSGGQTVFHAQWSAPMAGGVVFHVYAISANGDGSNRGDGAGEATLALASGCGAGKTYYLDQDADGYGTSDTAYASVIDCAKPQGYADNNVDCDDFRETVYPSAAEICDGKDNDCNGKVDDGTNLTLCGAADSSCVQGHCSGGAGGTGGRATGGVGATGGRPATGGSFSATGGASGTGGTGGSTGGHSGSGGTTATGGAGTGGRAATGGGMTGGAGPSSTGGAKGDDTEGGCRVEAASLDGRLTALALLGASVFLVRRRRKR